MQLKEGYIYWQTGDDEQLTPYFNTREFESPKVSITGTHKISMELVSMLHAIRVEWGKPIKVTSGYRTKEYQENLRLAGYPTAKGISQHELGNAADIKPLHIQTPSEIVRLDNIVNKFFKAIGRANTFTHVDTRRDKLRLWTY